MKAVLTACLLLVAPMLWAQSQKAKDVEAINAMCGCYEIKFNFAETFAPDPNYAFHDNYRSGGLEYVFPAEVSEDKIVLQHLLIIGDSMIIKHWRQDWIYENTNAYAYAGTNTWAPEPVPFAAVEGQWTQRVGQVDDSPRYEGTAAWVHANGRHYWENASMAPLPRREFSKRKDYNIMLRRNRHEITSYGWVHEQDNDKIIREDNQDELLAQEKGWNTYTKVDPDKCALAVDWWKEHGDYWNVVRGVWDDLFATGHTVKLKKRVDGQLLFMRLFTMQDELKPNFNPETARATVKATIMTYLEGNYEKFASKDY